MVSSPAYSLILASSSPRRSQLLQSAGIPFTLAPAPWEEPPPTPEEERHPALYVEKLARHKAESCDLASLPPLPGKPLVLTADTIVWHAGKILNKPTDEAEANAMLRSLCGHTHQVLTGVCLRDGAAYFLAHETTYVTFQERDDAWIARYVATGEPMDKAGAYAAQGRGSFLLKRIEGDYSNVVGLPLALVGRMLEERGINYQQWW